MNKFCVFANASKKYRIVHEKELLFLWVIVINITDNTVLQV